MSRCLQSRLQDRAKSLRPHCRFAPPVQISTIAPAIQKKLERAAKRPRRARLQAHSWNDVDVVMIFAYATVSAVFVDIFRGLWIDRGMRGIIIRVDTKVISGTHLEAHRVSWHVGPHLPWLGRPRIYAKLRELSFIEQPNTEDVRGARGELAGSSLTHCRKRPYELFMYTLRSSSCTNPVPSNVRMKV